MGELRRLIEKGRTAGPSNKGYRPSNLARVGERGAAIDEDFGGCRDREGARARNVFLLKIDEYQDRDRRGINVGSNIDYRIHVGTLLTGDLIGRILERSNIPGECQLPSGLMIT